MKARLVERITAAGGMRLLGRPAPLDDLVQVEAAGVNLLACPAA